MTIYCVKGLILTMNKRNDIFPSGIVVFDDSSGEILAVDRNENTWKHECEFMEGGKYYVVLPGLINTHTHAPMIVLQGLVSGLTGFEWLRKIWYLESLLKPSDIYISTRIAIALMLENGITTFSDHYFYEEEVAKAVEEIGVRAVLAKSVVEFSDYAPKHSLKDSVDFAIRFMNRANGRITTMIGVHALYSCSIETVKESVEVSDNVGLRIHMHFSESLHELDYVRKQFGTTPAELAERIGLLRTKPLLAHATYLTDNDVGLIARYKPSIAYSPFTIMSWGQSIARVYELLKHEVPVSLATDGPVTSGDLCLFKEMKLAVAAQSSFYKTPHRLTPQEVLEMVTRHAAIGLGLDSKVGSLEPGKRADVVVLKPSLSRYIGLYDDPYYTVVYSLDCRDVYSVYVDGKKLVDKGTVTAINIENTYKDIYIVRERILAEAK